MHHLSADAFPLKRTIYKELSNKKTIILHCALQPANVGTLDSDDADLRQRPLLAKTNRLSSPIQVQFLNDFLHSGEVQTFAIFEILSARGTKCDLHWLIRSTDDAGLQVTGWSLDFKLTHYHPVSAGCTRYLTVSWTFFWQECAGFTRSEVDTASRITAKHAQLPITRATGKVRLNPPSSCFGKPLSLRSGWLGVAVFALSLFIAYDLIAIHLWVTPCSPNITLVLPS